MQHTQYNYIKLCARVALVVGVILAANPASGAPAEKGRIAYPGKPDPLLDGGETSACMAGADVAGTTDATGQPVVPADVGAPRVIVPDEVMVPIRGAGRSQPGPRGRAPVTGAGDGAYAGFDGRRMAPLLNPRPCR